MQESASREPSTGRIALRIPYGIAWRHCIRMVPGRRWDTVSRAWTVPDTETTRAILGRVFGPAFAAPGESGAPASALGPLGALEAEIVRAARIPFAGFALLHRDRAEALARNLVAALAGSDQAVSAAGRVAREVEYRIVRGSGPRWLPVAIVHTRVLRQLLDALRAGLAGIGS